MTGSVAFLTDLPGGGGPVSWNTMEGGGDLVLGGLFCSCRDCSDLGCFTGMIAMRASAKHICFMDLQSKIAAHHCDQKRRITESRRGEVGEERRMTEVGGSGGNQPRQGEG